MLKRNKPFRKKEDRIFSFESNFFSVGLDHGYIIDGYIIVKV